MRTITANQIDGFSGRIIDVRNPDEFATGRLNRAECVPLPTLASEAARWDRGEPLLLMCKSGMRSKQACDELTAAGFSNVTMLTGGIDACRKAGVDLVVVRKTLPIIRQVMIAASSLLLIGLIVGIWYPVFHLIDWFVAGGLMFAGLTGNCMMASLLGMMPWNKTPSCCAAASVQKG